MARNADVSRGMNSDAHYATSLVLNSRESNLLDKINSSVLPRLTAQDGVRRVYVLEGKDRAPEEYVIFALWNSKESADRFADSNDYKESVGSLRGLLESGPTISESRVVSHFVNAEELPPPDTTENQA